MNDVTLSGLELTQRIMREGDDIAYIALSEITDRNRSVSAARVDFSAVGLGPWLKRAAGASGDEEAEDEEEPDADDDDGDDEHDLSDALGGDLASPRQLAVGAMRWLDETVTSLMAGRTHGKFKINLWSPGGKTLIHSARFEAKNPSARQRPADVEAEVEAERATVAGPAKGPDLAPTVHSPSPRSGPPLPEERVWQALGDGYTQLIALTQSTYSHIAKLQAAEIQSLFAQNKRLSDTVEAVSEDLRAVHIGTAQAERDEVTEAAAAKVKEELGKQFIDQVGAGVRAYIASKASLPPELVDVVGTLSQSPELMEALRDPDVQHVIRQPEITQTLAATLRDVAQGMKAARAAEAKTAQQRPPPPDPTPPTDGAKAA
ncbi:MAG: hypothetical protein ACOZNI_27915 [Myxococcota bacterium]